MSNHYEFLFFHHFSLKEGYYNKLFLPTVCEARGGVEGGEGREGGALCHTSLDGF